MILHIGLFLFSFLSFMYTNGFMFYLNGYCVVIIAVRYGVVFGMCAPSIYKYYLS